MNTIYICSLKGQKLLFNLPLLLLLSFLIVTEVLFFIGPIIYDINSEWKIGAYLLVNNIALAFGYNYGKKKYVYKRSTKPYSIKTLYIYIILYLLIIPIKIHALWGINPLSLSGILNQIIVGLQNPGEVYSSKLELVSGLTAYLNIILSPLTYIAIARVILERKKLKNFWLYLGGMVVLWEFLIPIGQGVRKGILDLLLMLIFLCIASNQELILDKIKRRKVLVFALIAGTVFISYFIYSNMSRYNIDDISVLLNENSIYSDIRAPYDTLSPYFVAGICSIEGYLCQGYYALSKALELPFTYTFGMGSSWFGLNLLNRFGIRLLPFTYVGQLEKLGIDPMINWHSIYVWLASDFTFVGVPIFVFFMGFFLSTTWLDVLTKRSVYAAPMFVLFAIMTFYSFANNQVFSLSFISFVVIFLLWYKFR